MASGTIVGTKTGNFGVEIDWVATPNTTTNSSTVVSKIYITYASISMGARTITSTINTTTATFTSAKVEDYPNKQVRRLMCTHTTSVDHSSNGTKSITISASVPFKITSSVHGPIDTLSASKEVVLDPIPRASTFTLATTTPTTGSTFLATITKADSTFRHRVELLINGVSKQTTDYFTGNTYGCTIDHSWIPSSNSLPGIVRLYTYTATGTSYIGYTEVAITANVDSKLQPTVSLKAALSSGGLNGYYIQSKSKATLTATATASSGSSIASYTFTGPNINASNGSDSITVSSSALTSSVVTSILKGVGTQSYQVVVKDTRGRTATLTTPIQFNVYEYSAPVFTSYSLQRCTQTGVLAKDGEYVKYTINSKFSPVLVGTTINNTRTVTISYSTNGGTSYSTPKTLQDATTTTTTVSGKFGDTQTDGTGEIKTTKSYKFKIVITDSYGASDTKYVDLGSIERPINVAKYGNGIALGGISSVTESTAEGLFECNWDAKFTGNVDVIGSFKPTTPIAIENGGTGAVTAGTARVNLAALGTVSDGSFYAILPPDGSTGVWMRTPGNGLIPYTQGGSSLGTADWKFANIHGVNIYENGTLLSSKYAAKSHAHGYARVLGWTTLANSATVNFTVSQSYGLIIVYMYINSDGYAAVPMSDAMLGQPMTISFGSSNYGFILSKSGTTFTLKRNGSASVSYIVDIL